MVAAALVAGMAAMMAVAPVMAAMVTTMAVPREGDGWRESQGRGEENGEQAADHRSLPAREIQSVAQP
jgi:hypothetical protein